MEKFDVMSRDEFSYDATVWMNQVFSIYFGFSLYSWSMVNEVVVPLKAAEVKIFI